MTLSNITQRCEYVNGWVLIVRKSGLPDVDLPRVGSSGSRSPTVPAPPSAQRAVGQVGTQLRPCTEQDLAPRTPQISSAGVRPRYAANDGTSPRTHSSARPRLRLRVPDPKVLTHLVDSPFNVRRTCCKVGDVLQARGVREVLHSKGAWSRPLRACPAEAGTAQMPPSAKWVMSSLSCTLATQQTLSAAP